MSFLTEFDEEKYYRTIREEGFEEGQERFVNTVLRLRNGSTPAQLLADGIPQRTIDLALQIV